MIKKLKSKIFFLIMISLTTITLGIIILFTFYNYRNTINTSAFFINRVFGLEERKDQLPPNSNNNIPKKDQMENSQMPEIEGFYIFIIQNSTIVEGNDNSSQIKDYALEVANKKSDTGIIGNYIYRVEKQRENEIRVILVENEDAISHIKLLIVISIVISIIALIIIYIISKNVSELIVKPVEETFSKQVQFISDASHELKTPLAVIEANADVLESEQGKSKWLTYIQNEIESMNKLINELLLLAKIENIDSIREKEEFDLSQEAEMVTSMFESMAYEKNVKINTKIEENVKIIGQKEDIEHILSTLIDNAIKHTESGKEIEVLLNKSKDNILIQVKNQGEPIPKEERNKIFERFYRIDKSRNRNEKRYGLGLAIAKSMVEKYKGSIEVDCKDGFTIFNVKIPM